MGYQSPTYLITAVEFKPSQTKIWNNCQTRASIVVLYTISTLAVNVTVHLENDFVQKQYTHYSCPWKPWQMHELIYYRVLHPGRPSPSTSSWNSTPPGRRGTYLDICAKYETSCVALRDHGIYSSFLKHLLLVHLLCSATFRRERTNSILHWAAGQVLDTDLCGVLFTSTASAL